MRIRRGPLFWGLLLIPLGAVPLLVRAGIIDGDTLAEAWRLWPIVLIALGIVLIVGRTRATVIATAVAALVLGLAGGGALATGNLWLGSIGDCGLSAETLEHVDQDGTFSGPATVRLDLDCGSADLATQGSGGWMLQADYRGPAPSVQASADRLEVTTPDVSGQQRQEWTVAIAPDLLRQLELRANAASVTADLAGSTLALVDVDLNAGDLLIDAGQAVVDRIQLTMNAGRSRITLGTGSTTGNLRVNAGALDICVPAEVGLRIGTNDQLTFVTNLDDRGLTRSGTTWTRQGASGAPVIDLSIEGNAASLTLDPEGGCT